MKSTKPQQQNTIYRIFNLSRNSRNGGKRKASACKGYLMIQVRRHKKGGREMDAVDEVVGKVHRDRIRDVVVGKAKLGILLNQL